MSTEHTPGPWKAFGTAVYFPGIRGGFDLRSCPNPEANARLIAAAPDLLDALKEVVRISDRKHDAWDAARAAIAKATGGA